ncbi:beta-ketoacyl synthase chain length factor [Chitinophaga tropicalis]|uniref:Beta-ketoacyl synthase-like N-terminal domain-containing protein n=1 Tax=Chitinophaga tropicalis TaxID=2683588 RepID=A0A7K1U609_9BACT|nr:beta-ketoacyl synthase chain length factor [Chitinophaga tropicalis]MVT09803.1 hypothetical protein [Chitinophaga tropicalis]
MSLFIQHTSGITPLNRQPEPLYHRAADPSYAVLGEPAQTRRMCRHSKMGLYTAMECLNTLEHREVDGIIWGTGIASFESAGRFLKELVSNNEALANPAVFVQSSHNTISGQLAQLIQCKGYNSTYYNGGFSFENVLMDALLHTMENEEQQFLIGASDEMFPLYYDWLKDGGIAGHTGYLPGEGAAAFLVSGKPGSTPLCKVDQVLQLYNPGDGPWLQEELNNFLERSGCDINDIDLLLLGTSADQEKDTLLQPLADRMPAALPRIPFKKYCGEYYTATAFALWLAVQVLQNGQYPESITEVNNPPQEVKRILVASQWQGRYYSFILVSDPFIHPND